MDPCRGGIACEICLGWVLLLFVDTAAGLHHRPPAPRPGSVPRNPPVPSTPVPPAPSTPVPPAPSTRVGPGVLLASPNSAVRYKILPAQLLGGENGIKLSLHVEKAPNRAISGEQGEFCTGSGAARLVLGEFCTAHAVRGGVLGEFCTAHAARAGTRGEFCTGSGPPLGPVAGLFPLMGTGAGPSGPAGALHDGSGGGFALHEALNRCVAGVSHPLVVQFPPSRGLPDGQGAQNADHLAKKR